MTDKPENVDGQERQGEGPEGEERPYTELPSSDGESSESPENPRNPDGNSSANSGASPGTLEQTLDKADEVKGQPAIIIARTVKGKGVSFAEHKAAFHNGMLDEAQFEQACRELQS